MKTNFNQVPCAELSKLYVGSDLNNPGLYTCMFSAISYASGLLGCSMSTSEVCTSYAQEYGMETLQLLLANGMGRDNADIAAETFFDVTYLGNSESLETFLENGNNTAIIAIPVGGGVSHAVNTVSISSDGSILYYDPEQGTYGQIWSTDVLYSIGLNGCL